MRKLRSFMLATLAATLLTCCQSPQQVEVDRPYLPELVFPSFPALSGAVRNGDGTATVGEDWVIRLAEFRIRFDELAANYNDLKALYEECADGGQ